MPQHERARETDRERQAVFDFIRWLADEKGWTIAEPVTDGRYLFVEGQLQRAIYLPARLAAEFCGIDYDAYHAEKDALLEYVRESRAGH